MNTDDDNDGLAAIEPPVTAAQIDALLPFLSDFEAEGYSYGEWRSAEGGLGDYADSDEVRVFVQVLYRHGWIVPFDWPSWQDEAERLVGSPEELAEVDAATIRRLLTVHVRKDRFCEGHLAEVLESGHILALLRRLREIRHAEPNETAHSSMDRD